MLNSSMMRLTCVLLTPPCHHRRHFDVERALSSSSCLKLTFELSSLIIKSVCEAHQTEQCSVGRNDPTQIWGCLRGAAMTTPNVPAGSRCQGQSARTNRSMAAVSPSSVGAMSTFTLVAPQLQCHTHSCCAASLFY